MAIIFSKKKITFLRTYHPDFLFSHKNPYISYQVPARLYFIYTHIQIFWVFTCQKFQFYNLKIFIVHISYNDSKVLDELEGLLLITKRSK